MGSMDRQPINDTRQPTQLEEDRHWWFASRTRALLHLMDALPRRDGDLRLLDVGCGAGNMIHHLSRYGQVRGVEIDARPAAVARQRGYAVDLGDAGRGLAYPDATFDIVTALDVIEHNRDDLSVLREAHRVLKPGGYLVVTTPALMWLWSYNDVLNAHVRRYDIPELRAKLQQVGFEIWRISYNNFLVFPMAAALILVRRAGGRAPQLRSHHLSAEAYQVEMEPAPPVVNALLTAVGWLEAQLVRHIDLPIGTGIIAIARKRAHYGRELA
ncbi:MAG: class I SAM-dependent methyltransferase [Anaerolineae bacterium]